MLLSMGDMQATDALLGVLTNNGGPTATHRPTELSPLINQIPLSECLNITGMALLEDQRGFIRSFDSLCDIGAVEVNTDIIFAHSFD